MTRVQEPRIPQAWLNASSKTEHALRGSISACDEVTVAVEELCADPELLRHPDLSQGLARLTARLDSLGLQSSSRALLKRVVSRLSWDWQELSPDNATLNRLAVTLADRGQVSAAATVLSIAVELDTPKGADAASARTFANLAAIRIRLGALPGAAEAARQALDRMPPNGTTEEDLELRLLVTAVLETAARHQNRHNDADRILDDLEVAARRLVDLLGGHHPKSLSALVTLASAEFEAAKAAEDHNRMERATDVLAITAQRIAATVGADHPQAVAALMSFAAVEGDAAWHTQDERRLAEARGLTALARKRAETAARGSGTMPTPGTPRVAADRQPRLDPPTIAQALPARTVPTTSTRSDPSDRRGTDPTSDAGNHAQKSALADDTASSHTLLEGRLGYMVESALLVRALTHRSYAYENGGLPTNERLEFLGDSVLGLVVTDTLYRTHPDLPEGHLAKLRAAVVNPRALAEVGRGLELGSFVRLGRGEEATGGRDKSSVLAGTLEAVIGAVYLDQGLDSATELVHRLFDPLIEKSSNLGAGLDWKTGLQELTATEGLGVPEYLVSEAGPDHEKTFTAAARVGGVSYGTGTGRSKKEAEQQAAESAWRAIRAAADARTGSGYGAEEFGPSEEIRSQLPLPFDRP